MNILLVIIFSFLTLLVVGLLIYFVIIFNGLVRLKNNIERAYANIDVLLKQRFDEVPQLVNICKGYMNYEKSVLKDITTLRNKFQNTSSTFSKEELNNALNNKMGTLLATIENYPNLKASKNFLHLQRRLSNLEMEIADRREFYNDSVNMYNIRIESFPDMIIANVFRYKKKLMFKSIESERKINDMSF